MFSIKFNDLPLEYPYDNTAVPAAPGALVIGHYTEDFLANLALWSKPDYEAHWQRELQAFANGRLKVALIVSYDHPKSGEIWCIYRDGEWARFQNQILFSDRLPDGFELSEASRHIDDRQVKDEDGNQISEWNVHIRDIESFLQRSNVL